MSRGLVIAWLFAAAPAFAQGWKLEVADAKRIEAEYRVDFLAPELRATEWAFVAAKPPELPGQRDVKLSRKPAAAESTESDPRKRPVHFARLKATNATRSSLTMTAKYEAVLRSRKLVPLVAGEKAPAVAELTEADRRDFLKTADEFNLSDERGRAWLEKHKLKRGEGESEIDYARRVFLAIVRNVEYHYDANSNRWAGAVCAAGRSDCGGMAVLFVAALRAEKIPARVLAGRWAVSESPEVTLNGKPYHQAHVKAEFYAAGVGWVPADPSSGVQRDDSDEKLAHFGNDAGDFLAVHIDTRLKVDSKLAGVQELFLLQGFVYWAAGTGGFDGATTKEKWTVTESALR